LGLRIVSLRATVDSAQRTEGTPAYKGRVKYTPEKARAYQVRAERKERAELRLVERAFQIIPRGRVLDAPCGGGRVTLLLAGLGHEMTAGDLSDSMIEITGEKIAEARLKIPVEKQDVERLTYPDQYFDSIISFRLFHHFPDAEIRQRVVRGCAACARTCRALLLQPLLLHFDEAENARGARRTQIAEALHAVERSRIVFQQLRLRTGA
jgi:2-polyprenyl-3-methyl-5-hydroxy-6-metoxy-1,4-benzoquinol methylase